MEKNQSTAKIHGKPYYAARRPRTILCHLHFGFLHTEKLTTRERKIALESEATLSPSFYRHSCEHCNKTQIKMVGAHSKINRTCKDDPTRYGIRRDKERQTEKEMGRQHYGMDSLKLGDV